MDEAPLDVLDQLNAIVGPDNVRTDETARAETARDGLRLGRAALVPALPDALPFAVVCPAETGEVVGILRTAASAGTPVVPYGGGTGLMGGARTLRPGIVLDLRRMNRVSDIQAEDRTARVQAGVVLADLNHQLAPHGLVCGHDPWTVPIATVGGALSTNGLGYLGARYGSIGDQLLGLEVVLADGTVVRTRPAERSSTGPQLRRLWVGAEGTLGVITEATLRVFPSPEERRLRALDFPSFSAGFAAVCAMAAIGLRPALLDFGGPPHDSGPARMVLGFEGYREEVEAGERRALAICAEHGANDRGPDEAREFFDDRHVDPRRLRGWRVGERQEPRPGTAGSAVFEYMHMYVPQSRVLRFCREATAGFEAAGAEVSEWGLWHQPELISLVARRRTDTPAALAALRDAHDAAARLAQDLGGSMEYVHGAGVRLSHLMAREQSAGLDVLAQIKRALDPDNLVNPGKLGL